MLSEMHIKNIKNIKKTTKINGQANQTATTTINKEYSNSQ